MVSMASAVIVDVVRTPVGKKNGRLSGWHAVDLAAQPLAGADGPQRPRPGAGGGRDLRVHHDGGRAGHEHRPQRGTGRRLPGHGARHHRRPAVRLGPAGRALRRPGSGVGRHGHRDRRRGRGHEPGADRVDHRARSRRCLRSDRPRPVRLHPPGPVRRGDRPPVGDRPRGDGPVRPAVPRAGRPRPSPRAASRTRSSRSPPAGPGSRTRWRWPAPTRATRPTRAR